MDFIINKIQIPIEDDGLGTYILALSHKMGVNIERLEIIKILSKDLDLRDQSQFYYRMSFAVRVEGEYRNRIGFAHFEEQKPEELPQLEGERPIIIGFGPAGMFAALELIDRGLKPIIFDRGKKIEERHIDVQNFIRKGQLNENSNIQFGEGGAGSYSDGKLFSRRNNNTGYVNRVLETFVRFGADPEIVYISKPHLGTDVLCSIVRNIRNYLLERGAEIHYNTVIKDILIEDGCAQTVVTQDDVHYSSHAIFLATGHSARDTYQMLYDRGVRLEQRPISIGLRIEHPVEEINLFRYGQKYVNYRQLEAAAYSVNYTNRDIKRGVYTFCMCPGGEVVNASSEEGHLVVNGMSYSGRDSQHSNGALVVSCHPSDYCDAHPLAGIKLQRKIERASYLASEGTWKAPAQKLVDFIDNKKSDTLPDNSFKHGLYPADMRKIFPTFIIEQLESAFAEWQISFPLFLTKNAVLMAAETRTSSPVRILRDTNYESVSVKNLFPIGEGSGHTGGITSSAADGVKAVFKFIDLRYS